MPGRDGRATAQYRARSGSDGGSDYFLFRRWTRVRFRSLRCFCLRIRLRRFLINDPMSSRRLTESGDLDTRSGQISLIETQVTHTPKSATVNGAGSDGHRPPPAIPSRVVQLAEHQTLNLGVAGSSPAPRANHVERPVASTGVDFQPLTAAVNFVMSATKESVPNVDGVLSPPIPRRPAAAFHGCCRSSLVFGRASYRWKIARRRAVCLT